METTDQGERWRSSLGRKAEAVVTEQRELVWGPRTRGFDFCLPFQAAVRHCVNNRLGPRAFDVFH